MFLRILVFINGACAAGFLLLGGYGAIAAGNPGDRQGAVMAIVFGLLIAIIALALHFRNRVAVILLSLPVMACAAVFAFILLFAPLAWGDANLGVAYGMQGVAALIILIQIAGIMAVFSRKA